MDDFSKNLSDVLKYGDETTVKNLSQQMSFADWVGTHPAADHTKRGVLADAYEEHTGDSDGAQLLRTKEQAVAFHKGKMVKGVVRHRDAAGEFGEDATDVVDRIRQHGPEDGLVYALGYDNDEGRLTDEPQWGAEDRKHTTADGQLTLSWNPRLDYWHLTEHHVVPESEGHKTYWHNGRLLNV